MQLFGCRPTAATGGNLQESTMKTLFAALTVLTLVFGTVALTVPANASTTNLFAPASNEGNSN
jgi:hypothetical protein